MKPLSDRIEELAVQAGYDGLPDDKADLLSAAAILRSVESAPVGVLRFEYLSERLVTAVIRADPPATGDFEKFDAIEYGQRVALVPLPQQSET